MQKKKEKKSKMLKTQARDKKECTIKMVEGTQLT